ncbi:amino acid transporter [Vibrio sp. MACH09]|uniref:LysE/ArgO family amino acid transporter n=1 Tax=unclassified Vibrio TaxID=2614977 RepID=UPI001493B385|nr:LysE/ArgO family amino acid transporter [Vibrio sp. MACH09]NOI68366.1 amino acid transporter [Vibrio sp. 99-8-1]GLO59884.1 amino acid transporter [Vibrio sp. MACH09]
MSFWILLQGFGLNAGMIIPIGAQNAYVLNQGINRQHHITTATLCSILDIILVSAGIFGGGALLSQNETLLTSVTVGGILFLTFYGYLSLRNAFNSQSNEKKSSSVAKGRIAVIMGALAVTILNPQVYLDTVVILGSIGGQFEGNDRIAFAIGTALSSLVWFYGLSLGAAKLAPTLSKPKVKKSIDFVVAMIMFVVALSLTKLLWEQYF